VESLIRFSVIPVPSLTVTIAVSAQGEVLAAAQAVAAEIAPRADLHDREGSFSQENIDALWRVGIGSLSLPERHGGPGANLRTTAAAVRAVAAGDASTGLVWVMHLIFLQVLADDSFRLDPVVRARVFASAMEGPALINALRVEPELGTPARGGIPATRAVLTADGFLVSGRKIFSTGSQGLRWMVVWAATSEDDPEGQRSGPFLVPADAPGITIVETWDHLGMRASASHDVVFDDTPIPFDHAAALLPAGTFDPGVRTAHVMGWMIVLLLSVYDGVAQAARDWLIAYLDERIPTNLGAPLASLPRFQAAVGEIDALLHANERLLGSLADDLDAGGEAGERAGRATGLAKVVVARNVISIAEQAVALIGNAGLTRQNPLQRHLRDALCSRIHSPQDDTILTNAGRAALERGG
jgi:alkylation response protein AidB-like acyl-CoA dehydrogenase